MKKTLAWVLFLILYLWACPYCFSAATTTFGDFVHNSPEITSPSGNDQIPIVRGASSNKVKLSTITDGVRPEWFGAVGNGTTDDATAINAAIAATYNATTGTYGTVQFGAKDYRVNSTINMAKKQGLVLKGVAGTRILGYTGAGKPTIDMVGATYSELSDITIKNYTSTVGVLLGASMDALGTSILTGQFFTKLSNINLTYDLNTAYGVAGASANHKLGTVGIANIGGENVNYHNVYVEAVLPMFLSSDVSTDWVLGDTTSTHVFSSDYATLPIVWTLGQQVFSGYSVLISYGWHRPTMVINNGNDFSLSGGYMNSAKVWDGHDGTFLVGVQINSGYNNKLHFLSEAQTHAVVMKHSLTSDIQVTAKDNGDSKAAIAFYGGTTGSTVYGNKITANIVENRYFLGEYPAYPFTGSIRNLEANSDQQNGGKLIDASLSAYVDMSVISDIVQTWNTRDYISGTVKATLTCPSGTITLNDASLGYTFMGGTRLVEIHGMLSVASVSTPSPNGELTLNGLPATVKAGNKNYSPLTIYANVMEASANTTMMGYVVPGTTTAIIRSFKSGVASTTTAEAVKAGTILMIQGFYAYE